MVGIKSFEGFPGRISDLTFYLCALLPLPFISANLSISLPIEEHVLPKHSRVSSSISQLASTACLNLGVNFFKKLFSSVNLTRHIFLLILAGSSLMVIVPLRSLSICKKRIPHLNKVTRVDVKNQQNTRIEKNCICKWNLQPLAQKFGGTKDLMNRMTSKWHWRAVFPTKFNETLTWNPPASNLGIYPHPTCFAFFHSQGPRKDPKACPSKDGHLKKVSGVSKVMDVNKFCGSPPWQSCTSPQSSLGRSHVPWKPTKDWLAITPLWVAAPLLAHEMSVYKHH